MCSLGYTAKGRAIALLLFIKVEEKLKNWFEK